MKFLTMARGDEPMFKGKPTSGSIQSPKALTSPAQMKPMKMPATSVPSQVGAVSWDKIAANLRAETGDRQLSVIEPVPAGRGAQAGAADWGDIAASLGAGKSASQDIGKVGR